MALGTGTEREHQERRKGCRQHPRRAPLAPRFCQQALSSSLPRARGAASLAQRSTHPVAHQPEEGWGLGLGAPGTGTGDRHRHRAGLPSASLPRLCRLPSWSDGEDDLATVGVHLRAE